MKPKFVARSGTTGGRSLRRRGIQTLFAVHYRDDIAGSDARPGRWRIVNGHHHLDNAVLRRHLDSNAAEFARRLHLHLTELPGVHVARVRIETGEHPIDRAFYEYFVWDWLDVFTTNSLKHVAEEVQQLIRSTTLAVLCKR
jgi:hypothetical protein